uniref:CAF1C_H4-bd domain-containing protein n=1 Tax=Hydatigena taeniaeformis TaxID=6205 RepID=A0A0R3WXL5_HYDTA
LILFFTHPLQRCRARSLQKAPTQPFDGPPKPLRSTRRVRKIQPPVNDDEEEDEVDVDNDDDEVVAAVEADLEDDRHGEEDEEEEVDSSSACATPDMADGLDDDVGVAPSSFGLAELMESHGNFFPEWTEMPGLVNTLVPPMKESTAGSSKDGLYEEAVRLCLLLHLFFFLHLYARSVKHIPGAFL